MAAGIMKGITAGRGYAFATVDGEDIFVHASVCDKQFNTLENGDTIECDVEQSERGPRAVNVRRVDQQEA
jgi:CspA family cold shock protein